MSKYTKAELEDMSIDELQKLTGTKEIDKAKMVAKLATKPK